MAHTICLCFVEKALWRTFCSAGGHQRSARNTVIANNLLILQSYPHQTIPDPHLMGRGYCIISIWIILRRVSPKFAGSLNVRVFYSIYTVYIHYTCSQYNIYIHYIYYIFIYLFTPLHIYSPSRSPVSCCAFTGVTATTCTVRPRSHKSRRTHLHDPRGTELLIAGGATVHDIWLEFNKGIAGCGWPRANVHKWS